MNYKMIFSSILLGLIVSSSVSLSAQGRRGPDPVFTELSNIKDSALLEKRIGELKASSRESDLISLAQFYYSKNQQEKVKDVMDIAAIRFPKGEMAYSQKLNAIGEEKDPSKMEVMLNELLAAFPNKANDYWIDIRRFSIASEFAKVKNTEKAKQYIDIMTNPDVKFMTMSNIASIMADSNPDFAASIIKQAIDAINEYRTNPNNPDLNKGKDPQGATNNPQQYYCSAMALYGNILDRQGKSEEALKCMKESYDGTTKKSATLSSDYTKLLLANKQDETALKVMEEMIKSGESNEQINTKFKEIYTKTFPGKNVNEYMNLLMSQMNKKITEEVATKMINLPTPDFYVTDVNGKVVKFADLKGKTLVLDFWATWCGPCKRSLPAMQMTVNKYKKDPSVKFLFIHTWEKVDNPLEDAKSYLAGKGFTFDLFMDMKDPKTKVNNAATNFKLEAIPTKLIIDPAGNIRFRITGISGGDDAIVSELSAMIELAKKVK